MIEGATQRIDVAPTVGRSRFNRLFGADIVERSEGHARLGELAVRGFGVLSWFMAPGSLGVTLSVGFIMLAAPVLQFFAALVLMVLGMAAVVLGLGDTWADWRNRARPTS